MSADATFAAITRRLVQWLPEGFVLVSAGADTGLSIPAADRALVANAVVKRQAEFIGGRWCAHRALALIGTPAAALPMGALGAPVWPSGVIGSITHERGRCIAVAGHRGVVDGLGLDLCAPERPDVLNDLAPLLLAPGEDDTVSPMQTLFCVKEAVVKAVSRAAGRFLDLREIVVRLEKHAFHARVAGLPVQIHGFHDAIDTHVFALATTGSATDPDACSRWAARRKHEPPVLA